MFWMPLFLDSENVDTRLGVRLLKDLDVVTERLLETSESSETKLVCGLHKNHV